METKKNEKNIRFIKISSSESGYIFIFGICQPMFRPFFIFSFSVFLLLLTFTSKAQEISAETSHEKKNFWQWETLTGDWGGARNYLVDHGVQFEMTYTGEVWGNISGGISKGAVYLDNTNLVLSLDLEKLVHWKGASFSLYGLGNWGGSPTEKTGVAQGTSNIDAPDAWKLYEVWLQQNFLDDRISLKTGLVDLNSEFDNIQTNRLFLNPSQGIGVDFAQTGVNGPSIFPTTSLAGRIEFYPIKNMYVKVGLFDGVPGDPNHPHSTQIKFHN